MKTKPSKSTGGLTRRSRASVAAMHPVKRSKAAVAACAKRAKVNLIPAETLLDIELDNLRNLRRRLCVYANSDSFCDCKYIARNPDRGISDGVAPRSGEQSGCCEVRRAIGQLETIKRGFELARQARGPQPAKP